MENTLPMNSFDFSVSPMKNIGDPGSSHDCSSTCTVGLLQRAHPVSVMSAQEVTCQGTNCYPCSKVKNFHSGPSLKLENFPLFPVITLEFSKAASALSNNTFILQCHSVPSLLWPFLCCIKLDIVYLRYIIRWKYL